MIGASPAWLGVLLTACTTFHYTASHQPAGCTIGDSTRWAVFLAREDQVDASKVDPSCAADPCRFECMPCHGQGLAEVTIKTNWLYSLLSVVTVGIVSPIQVSYSCAGPS